MQSNLLERDNDRSKVLLKKEGKMESQLYRAARQGNVKFLKRKGSSTSGHTKPDEYLLGRTKKQNNIVHIAVEAGHRAFIVEALRLCPLLGCQQNSKGDTPIHVAARSGHTGLVKLLVNSYSNSHLLTSSCDSTESPAASIPADVNDIEAGVVPTKKHGGGTPPWRFQNVEGSTALHEALRHKHELVALFLLNLEPELAGFVNEDHESPLYLAAYYKCWRTLSKILSSSGVEYSRDGPEGQNPLHAMAIASGSIRSAELLLKEHPQLINQSDEFGKTALHYAVVCSSSYFIRWLLKKNADSAYLPDAEGLTPLLIAVRCRGHLALKAILEICPDSIELVDNAGQHALHLAVLNNRASTVKRFLELPEMKELINKPDNDGNTPLHLATRASLFDMVKQLLATKCADLKAQNKAGRTALDICESESEPSNALRFIWHYLIKHKASRGRQRHIMWRMRPTLKTIFHHPKKDLKQMANTLSVVAALLTTLTFAAAFTLPGGYKQNQPAEGSAVLSGSGAFVVFVLSDTVAVCCSLTVVFLLILAVVGDPTYLYWAILYSSNLLFVALYATLVAFISGLFAVLSEDALYLAVMVCLVTCCVPFLIHGLNLKASSTSTEFTRKTLGNKPIKDEIRHEHTPHTSGEY